MAVTAGTIVAPVVHPGSAGVSAGALTVVTTHGTVKHSCGKDNLTFFVMFDEVEAL